MEKPALKNKKLSVALFWGHSAQYQTIVPTGNMHSFSSDRKVNSKKKQTNKSSSTTKTHHFSSGHLKNYEFEACCFQAVSPVKTMLFINFIFKLQGLPGVYKAADFEERIMETHYC